MNDQLSTEFFYKNATHVMSSFTVFVIISATNRCRRKLYTDRYIWRQSSKHPMHTWWSDRNSQRNNGAKIGRK